MVKYTTCPIERAVQKEAAPENYIFGSEQNVSVLCTLTSVQYHDILT